MVSIHKKLFVLSNFLTLLVASCSTPKEIRVEEIKPIIINICDESTEYINFETILLKDGMYLVGNEPKFAEKDANGEYIFPEDSWFRFENHGVTWEAKYKKPGTGELEYSNGYIGYEWNFEVTSPEGIDYVMSVTEHGDAGLIRENGLCYPKQNL